MIFQDKIDEILARADLVEIASEFVKLKNTGNSFIGLCPFHHEKTPSFHISREKQLYHCFGCGAGGNVITFLKEIKQITFYEALKELAARYNIQLQEHTLRPKYKKDKEYFDIIEFALNFFKKQLFSSNGTPALEYLRNRQINDDTIVYFKIGFAPAGWDNLKNELSKQGFNLELATQLGLLSFNQEKKSYYDKYRNRIIFPITSLSGQIIGFGGRIIDPKSEEAKYINSSESPIYHKRKTLYGLYHAIKSIKEKERVILVEGYLDYLTLYQNGITNVIASSGTALTEEQVELISRYTKNIFIVYDADSAGQKATDKSIELFLKHNFNTHIVTLPNNYDPDTFVIEHGSSKFRDLLNSSENFIDYKWRQITKNNSNDVYNQSKAITEIINLIALINDDITKELHLKNISKKFNLEYSLLANELNKIKNRDINKENTALLVSKETTEYKNEINFEKEILALLLNFDNSVNNYIISNIDLNYFTDKHLIEIAEFLYTDNNITNISSLYEYIEDLDTKKLLLEISDKLFFNNKNDLYKYTFDLIKKIKIEQINFDIKQLQETTNLNKDTFITLQKLLEEKKSIEQQKFDISLFTTQTENNHASI